MQFWEARASLWPSGRSGDCNPFVPPVGDELDRLIAKALTKRGLTAASYKKIGCKGLVDRPRRLPMQMVVGANFNPYFELRCFWLPFALEYARIEKQEQAHRRDQVKAGVGPLLSALDKLKADIASFPLASLYRHAGIWERRPSKRRYARKELQDAIEALEEQINAILVTKDNELGYALERAERLAENEGKVQLHGNFNVWSVAFVTIMAIAWARLSGKNPGVHTKEFRDFLATAWDVTDDAWTRTSKCKENFTQDAACASVLDQSFGWQRLGSLGWLFRNAESTWHSVLNSSPFDDKVKLHLETIFEEERMLPRHRRIKMDRVFLTAAQVIGLSSMSKFNVREYDYLVDLVLRATSAKVCQQQIIAQQSLPA